MKKTLITTDIFINKSRKIHGEMYDYSMVSYVNAITPVTIICTKHGEFLQRPDLHINRKSNCPKCGYEQRAKTRRAKTKRWTYKEAKEYVNNLQFTSISEWNRFCKTDKRPELLPACPKITYREDWQGWTDWIGKNNRSKEFLPFEKARLIARGFKLRSYEDWVHFCSMGDRPSDVPFNPKHQYNEQWSSWGDWLGYESRANGNLPGIIYILRQEDLPSGVYKIGRTYRLDKRLYEHQRISQSRLFLVATFNVDNMKIAEEVVHGMAQSLGEKYKYHRSKEHFRIDDIELLIKHCTDVL